MFNKKSELLLMKRATASVESGATSGVTVERAIITRKSVYLQPFSRKVSRQYQK